MSWLDEVLDSHEADCVQAGEANTFPSDMVRANVKKKFTDQLLNLIEQSKEKSLPLTWLTGEIKKL